MQHEQFPRFAVGDVVFVRDVGRGRRGYRIVEARVVDVHSHPGRAPFYPHGEGYAFNGSGASLMWDCYPGCRVFATRAEAVAARLTRLWVVGRFYGGVEPAECGACDDWDTA